MEGVRVLVLMCVYESTHVAQARIARLEPYFCSHASHHITCIHHGAEADDGNADVGDPYRSCSSAAVER